MNKPKDWKSFNDCWLRCVKKREWARRRGDLAINFAPVRFLDGVEDLEPLNAQINKNGRYTWRVRKIKSI